MHIYSKLCSQEKYPTGTGAKKELNTPEFVQQCRGLGEVVQWMQFISLECTLLCLVHEVKVSFSCSFSALNAGFHGQDHIWYDRAFELGFQ